MQLLLDTHALLWWVLDSKELSRKARAAIGDFDNEVFVSAATAWEIAIKFQIGRLPDAGPLVHAFSNNLNKLGFSELAISVKHAQRAGLLSGAHKDPFDRMLIAQAQTDGLLLVSNEKLFDAYQIHRLW